MKIPDGKSKDMGMKSKAGGGVDASMGPNTLVLGSRPVNKGVLQRDSGEQTDRCPAGTQRSAQIRRIRMFFLAVSAT